MSESGTPSFELPQDFSLQNEEDGAVTVIENDVAHEALKDQIFSYLEEQGILENHERQIVIDVEKFTTMKKKELGMQLKRKAEFAPYLESGLLGALLTTFDGMQVISKEDWTKGIRTGRQFFYAPKTFEDAMNREELQKSDFYLAPHEVIKNVPAEQVFPGASSNFSIAEGTIPLLIYHPKYGDGYRDAQGKLMVRYNDGSYKPISKDWFVKEMHFGGSSPARGKASLHTPYTYFSEQASRLLENDIVRLDDFEFMSYGKTGGRYRLERRITSTGMATIDNIRYFLGREWEKEKEDARVYKLSPTFGGVTVMQEDGSEQLTHVFDLTTPSDSRLRPMIGETEHGHSWRAPRDVANCRPYDPKEFQRKRPEESDEVFAERVRTVDDFHALLRVSAQLSREAGVNMSTLDFSVQQWATFAAKAMETRKETMSAFVKKYGTEGLTAFLSLEYGKEMGEAILTLGENLSEEAAERVFAKYSEIVRVTEDVRQYVQEQFGAQLAQDPVVMDQIVENLLKRGKDFLVRFADKAASAKKEQQTIAVEDILAELARVKTDILLFASAFRESVEYDLNFEDMRDVRFESLRSEDIRADSVTVDTMRSIYEGNYQHYPKEFRDAVLHGFDEALRNPETNFYIFRFKDEIAAFCRFDDIRDAGGKLTQVYFGSFNVNPKFGQSRIGITMLEKILERESTRGVSIIADCDPKAPITSRYLKHGFEVREQYELHGVPSLRIERPPVSQQEGAAKSLAA